MEDFKKHKIYPVLKPANWDGLKYDVVTVNILGELKGGQLPVALTFGYNTPEHFVFLNKEMLGEMTEEELVARAFKNLEDFEAPISHANQDSPLFGKMLFASGQDLSSEKLFCKSHMLKAHEMLEAETLLVSVPRRTCMYILDERSDEEAIQQFMMTHAFTWADDAFGNAPIFNGVFHVKAGEIIGIRKMDAAVTAFGEALYQGKDS